MKTINYFFLVFRGRNLRVRENDYHIIHILDNFFFKSNLPELVFTLPL